MRACIQRFVVALCLLTPSQAATLAAALRVVVVDADDHKPLPTARITITRGDESVASGRPVDANGVAEFPDLRPGRGYSIRVSFLGYRTELLSGVVIEAGDGRTMRTVALRAYVGVSLATLLANPVAYAGNPIRVVGFLSVAPEGDAIYFHEEDFRQQLTKNALWVDIPVEQRKSFKAHDQHYVLIEGDFNARIKGHLDLFGGSIESVQRIEGWPP